MKGQIRSILTPLLCPNQPDARRKRASLKLAESAVLRGIHDSIHNRGIAAIRSVLHHAAQPKVSAAKVEAPLESWAEIDVIWIAPRFRCAHKLVVGINGCVRKSRAPVKQINKIPTLLQHSAEAPAANPKR